MYFQQYRPRKSQYIVSKELSFSNWNRAMEAFLEKGVTERIARTRHRHYDEKRKANIRIIEEGIKRG